MSVKRYQVLGKALHSSLEYTLKSVLVDSESHYSERTARGQIQQQFDRVLNIGDMVAAATLEHLGYGPIDNLHIYLNRGVDRSVEYFFGDWWIPDESDARALDKSRSDRALRWFEALPNSLLLGGLTGRWDDVAKICSWFDATIETEYQAGLIEDEYLLLFLCIASDLSSNPMPGVEEIMKTVESCTNRRTKLLRAVWKAAVARDQIAFDKAFKSSVSHFLKADAQDVPNVCLWIARHPSIIWLIAERNGLRFPLLPDELDAAVIRRQTIGFA